MKTSTFDEILVKAAKEKDRKRRAVLATLKWQDKNPEKKKATNRKYHQNHPEVKQKWQDENREKTRLYSKRYRNKKALEG